MLKRLLRYCAIAFAIIIGLFCIYIVIQVILYNRYSSIDLTKYVPSDSDRVIRVNDPQQFFSCPIWDVLKDKHFQEIFAHDLDSTDIESLRSRASRIISSNAYIGFYPDKRFCLISRLGFKEYLVGNFLPLFMKRWKSQGKRGYILAERDLFFTIEGNILIAASNVELIQNCLQAKGSFTSEQKGIAQIKIKQGLDHPLLKVFGLENSQDIDVIISQTKNELYADVTFKSSRETKQISLAGISSEYALIFATGNRLYEHWQQACEFLTDPELGSLADDMRYLIETLREKGIEQVLFPELGEGFIFVTDTEKFEDNKQYVAGCVVFKPPNPQKAFEALDKIIVSIVQEKQRSDETLLTWINRDSYRIRYMRRPFRSMELGEMLSLYYGQIDRHLLIANNQDILLKVARGITKKEDSRVFAGYLNIDFERLKRAISASIPAIASYLTDTQQNRSTKRQEIERLYSKSTPKSKIDELVREAIEEEISKKQQAMNKRLDLLDNFESLEATRGSNDLKIVLRFRQRK